MAALWLLVFATDGGRAGGNPIPPCEGCGSFPLRAQTLLTVAGVVLAFALIYAVMRLVGRRRRRAG
ncbi:MAG: hypothetical protein QOH58_213 [Thermoleophilaceae bacterium]|jgi:hypothetical protein|nr:hypothetical protein [Thermoleophilaceae bacterium]